MHIYIVFTYRKQPLLWVLFPSDIYEELKILLRMEASTINIHHTRLKFGLAALVKYPIESRGSAEITVVYHESLQRKQSLWVLF